MKRAFISIFLFGMILLGIRPSNAQVAPTIPNNSFENWSTGQGYNVSILSLYSSYQYPTDWNYLSYPVNETINLGFFSVNVNTNIPLLKASAETSNVPDGQKALKIQSFKVSDIINSTAYSLVTSYLDSEMLNMVFPTVLATGAMNLDNFMLLMDDVLDNLNNETALLNTVVGLDVNDYVTGGIALNGFRPGQLTGSYKYTSAVSNDMGGIIMFGTKYNTQTGRRDVVGGGGNLNFSDVSTYTPFSISYTPLSEINSTYPFQLPDTLVIALISSATVNRQQGSAFYIDNLNLVEAVTEPDTCPDVTGLVTTNVANTSATLTWSDVSNLYEIEYGLHGFAVGTGTTQNAFTNQVTLNNLQPDSQYDFHVRAVCGDNFFGDWAMTTFQTTAPDTCPNITGLVTLNVDTTSATLTWSDVSNLYEIEYGPHGFAIGSGTLQSVNTNQVTLNGLQPASQYDMHVRAVCDNDLYGNWSWTTFQTDSLQPSVEPIDTTGIEIFDAQKITIYPNPALGFTTVQFAEEIPASIQVYTIDGKLIESVKPTQSTIRIEFPSRGVFLLRFNTSDGTFYKKLINK